MAETTIPKWERLIPILTFVFMIVGGIWFGGGEWTRMQEKISALVASHSEIGHELKAMRQRIETIEQGNAERRNDDARESNGPVTPHFAPEWTPRR